MSAFEENDMLIFIQMTSPKKLWIPICLIRSSILTNDKTKP